MSQFPFRIVTQILIQCQKCNAELGREGGFTALPMHKALLKLQASNKNWQSIAGENICPECYTRLSALEPSDPIDNRAAQEINLHE